ncbi:MAG: SWIM zinc finger family protein [Chloracidobacterium sp.]|nr:SWIM zinc finger family protein [Chloracidobacterium sp.]
MEELAFEVQGSAPEPYKVTFTRRSQDNLSAYCTCAAGANGQYCKHRLAILGGDASGIISPNSGEAKIAQSWLPGTDVEKALLKLRELELAAARIKNEITSAKKEVAAAMRS